MDCPAPTGCTFCDALARVRDDPAVARLLDRLRDEATVALCRMTGVDVPEERARDPARKRMLRALVHGPLLLRELVDEAYPVPTSDPEEAALRRGGVRSTLYRLVLDGTLVRLARGRFALPGALAGERPVATVDDCLRILADPNVNPPGLTSRELADRLDVPVTTLRKWLERLRDQDAPIAAVPEPNPRGGLRYRYRIEATERREVA